MMKLRVLARLIQIQRVLVRHGLDEFVHLVGVDDRRIDEIVADAGLA